MTLRHDLRHRGARVLAPVALATALLTACGGGTSQVEAFQPARLVVLGDETSALVDKDGSQDGYRHGLNDRRGTAAGKCLLQPSFPQMLASLYGFVFAQCNPTNATVQAFNHAKPGATVADASTGLARQVAEVRPALGPTDMVSVMIGINDMIAAYEQVRDGRLTEAQALAQVETAAKDAAAVVTDILKTGARAIVVTVPDMSLSPYATAQERVYPGAKALLKRLAQGTSSRPGGFNGYVTSAITPSNGRNFGKVFADTVVSQIERFPTSFLSDPANKDVAACTSASALDCVLTDTAGTTTLVTGASVNTHLWATDRLMGPAAHREIGQEVQSRAINNPF